MSEENKKTNQFFENFRTNFIKGFRSMKLRIFVSMMVAGIVPAIIFRLSAGVLMEQEMVKGKIERILNQGNILRDQLISCKYFENGEYLFLEDELAQISAMYNGRVMVIGADFEIIEDTYVIDENKTIVSTDVLKAFKGKNISKYNKKSNYIETSIPVYDDAEKVIGVLSITASTKDIEYAMMRIDGKLSVVTVIVLFMITIFAYIVSYRLVRPFKRLEKTFEKVSEGNFDNKLSLNGYSETEEIASSYNDMLDKMKMIDESRQEFVSNVSHELKTPITSIKVLADSLMMQEDVPAELYKEFFEDIVNEIDRENTIITDLLSLVRTEKKNTTLNIESININELVEIILKRLRPIAAKKNIEIVLESFRPILASVDEIKITSAITNLVENAIKYNVMDGWVRVTLNADHKYFYIRVADSGIGIPEESQERVFERFYRVDKTRSRQTGGTGLGLAITSNIVKLHNGAIKVYSKEGEGTTFTIRIPLNYVNYETVTEPHELNANNLKLKKADKQTRKRAKRNRDADQNLSESEETEK